jgi:TatD DNase family protein
VRFYDAHNHLQDERFSNRVALIERCRREGVRRMVVNGACEEDWPAVAELAQLYPEVLPSFGYHPWYLHERTPEWQSVLNCHLDTSGGAIGEIGLDRWKPGLEYAGQEEAFVAQLLIATKRNVPASIHCLEAWGRLFDLLRETPRPECGFLLHSYGGPQEMVAPLAKLGAYFSFPGYYAHDRKSRQRETFRHVPPDRLLIETDAPDQPLPDLRNRNQMFDAAGKSLNHPANIRAVYEVMSEVMSEPLETIAQRVEENFLRLFGRTAD